MLVKFPALVIKKYTKSPQRGTWYFEPTGCLFIACKAASTLRTWLSLANAKAPNQGCRRLGWATRGLRKEVLMRDMGTIPECRHRVCKNWKNIVEINQQLPNRTRTCYPQVNSARFSHRAIASPWEIMDRCYIIIIIWRHGLPLLKPEWADGAVVGKDSSITFGPSPSHSALMKKTWKINRITDSLIS